MYRNYKGVIRVLIKDYIRRILRDTNTEAPAVKLYSLAFRLGGFREFEFVM